MQRSVVIFFFEAVPKIFQVGGLPLPELNQLELQFLLLNDFRLVISTTEMQHYAEQLIQVSSMPLPLSLPSSNGHSPRLHRQPSTPIPSSSDSSSTMTGGTTQSHQPYQTYSQPQLTKPAPSHIHTSSRSPPSSSSSSSISSFRTSSSPAGPLDALGGVQPPVDNLTNHPAGVPHSHPPHSHQHAHPAEYQSQQVDLRDQVHQRHMRERYGDVQGKTPLVGSYSVTRASSSMTPHAVQQQQDALEDAEDDGDLDTVSEADASTDAGTETSTDEEPTIRAPGTVVGGGSVNGSVWGGEDDHEQSHSHSHSRSEDARMRSP